ncbi:pirin family protein [uncultured Marinobacter sp.]|uniref:pirin family protein n=1 Tax=uncultured Marinobacter sp. TaxID=187379 RepID=UPI0030DB87CB|tara:strand:+ start:993 stop:1907 length:915 start_codon:yes stop_codon:yes gene_type:complete
MSNTLPTAEQECSALQAPCKAIELLLTPRVADLGGFSVRRLLPTAKRKMVGPWIFFDEMGPATFTAGEGINVRPHPHIGIATVTYLFEGEILHRDSVSSLQPIRPGDINLMVAGRGIAHSERERPEITNVDHGLHGLQLWLALPDEHEETEPSFHHYREHEIPAMEVDGVPVRVMIGSAWGVTSPVLQFYETLYAEASLKAGQVLELPDASERAVYVVQGSVDAEGTNLLTHSMAIVSAGERVSITAAEDARIVLIGGEPAGPRFIEWNFVSSRKERIAQAKNDWREGRFDKVSGDEEEFIPIP